MRVGGRTIQNKKIISHTNNDFEARYKRHTIFITTNHGHGKSEHNHLTRFDIDVIHDDGGYAVQTYEDLHSMHDAIIFALKGAML